jgi:hypothetical protein
VHRILRRLTALIATVIVAASVVATPAHAATYRDLKSVRYGACFYAYGDPLLDLYLKPCNTKPAQYGNWTVTVAGSYNNHPLWVVRRQNGKCLGIIGDAKSGHLYSTCSAKGYRNVWEVFNTSGRIVLKSFGAFRTWGTHRCLTFDRSSQPAPRLGACSLTNVANQIYR